MASATFVIGAALRPSFRMLCFQLHLGWDEQKGFLQSAFRVVGNDRAIRFLNDKVEEIKREEAAALAHEQEQREARDRRRHNRWYRRAWRMGAQYAKLR